MKHFLATPEISQAPPAEMSSTCGGQFKLLSGGARPDTASLILYRVLFTYIGRGPSGTSHKQLFTARRIEMIVSIFHFFFWVVFTAVFAISLSWQETLKVLGCAGGSPAYVHMGDLTFLKLLPN